MVLSSVHVRKQLPSFEFIKNQWTISLQADTLYIMHNMWHIVLKRKSDLLLPNYFYILITHFYIFISLEKKTFLTKLYVYFEIPDAMNK